MKLRNFVFVWNLWPPFLGLGIRIKDVSKDFRKVTVVLKKRPWNANYYGTQYGGGIFAMTDGIHILMLIQNLPKKYKIWDKSATINYIRRGTTHLIAEFKITEQDLMSIQQTLSTQSSMEWVATVDIFDAHGEIIAKVSRTISIKHKLA